MIQAVEPHFAIWPNCADSSGCYTISNSRSAAACPRPPGRIIPPTTFTVQLCQLGVSTRSHPTGVGLRGQRGEDSNYATTAIVIVFCITTGSSRVVVCDSDNLRF